ncbi:L-threonine 3-dehydrogenase [Paenactinomyces guangxiensis]|uniref:L-threonine 3-dehydrogenase n=1 Tax=Paenactinomyces guangxiensis TaxID=1490290 RepID=A0A7W1WR50_9BACL|nr:L-threonine 3-dehydrogenase [Paenactinomyces guangxiensis]MBA4494428.1 L-threonine 3-dehydrogenase [Paenactinomyces guangxiensis]MBH8591517.1 L-threonine 3-dehydrogenase [Paenactinomyces guangxiensis]
MEGIMRALVKHHKGEGAILKEVPIPSIGPDEVLIRVKATSICGTDVHIYTWDDWAASRIRPPYVFGHELGGEVVQIGENVTSVQLGDHVSAETHIVCGHCSACRRGDAHVCLNTKIIGVDRDGCFTEYVALPASNLWKNSKELPFEIASLMEPMGNAVHTTLSESIVGKAVAVVGCGPIGLMAVAVARASGAAKVIASDLNEYRLNLAEQMGATHLIRPRTEDPVQTVKAITKGEGADVVLEMSGHPTGIRQGFEMITHGGRISLLGLPGRPVELDITNDIVFKGITVHGITGRRMYETWEQTAGLLESGLVDLKPLITHRLPLEDFEEGFELMKSGNCGKVVFTV